MEALALSTVCVSFTRQAPSYVADSILAPTGRGAEAMGSLDIHPFQNPEGYRMPRISKSGTPAWYPPLVEFRT
jgi:hypothetical protein